mmetsp:Transcript_151746/g.265181  ORF Transcript_151746/g.265181 Transcript_151746/m.265181 type:complete len:148 (+) Transcript_151746:417-860(+)
MRLILHFFPPTPETQSNCAAPATEWSVGPYKPSICVSFVSGGFSPALLSLRAAQLEFSNGSVTCAGVSVMPEEMDLVRFDFRLVLGQHNGLGHQVGGKGCAGKQVKLWVIVQTRRTDLRGQIATSNCLQMGKRCSRLKIDLIAMPSV